MEILIGRKEEQAVLREVLGAGEAQLVAIYGRRRVGKTYLVRQFFQQYPFIEYNGIHNGTLRQQLEGFTQAMTRVAGRQFQLAVPASWMDAFQMLENYAAPLLSSGKLVVFFDEFPWLHTPRSGFEQAFGHFWNTWASRQPNLIVVICGSAASWMIQHVVNSKGGLHNRLTKSIRLLPFTLQETEQYLASRKVKLNHYQLLQLYMAMGGIPQYLKEIKAGQSAVQNIDRICFAKDGLLNDEFDQLYQSLFDHAEKHTAIIRALARKASGLTRNEVIAVCKLQSGGGTTNLLNELEESGFITAYTPLDKTTKDNIYKITDEYSLFYIRFIAPNKKSGKDTWAHISTGASWRSWSGMAFESTCSKHLPAIKKALGIPAVYTRAGAWRYHSKTGEQGAQIDLLIDRKDDSINICEMKFSEQPFEIQKSYAAELENKMAVFKQQTGTRKQLFLTMITTHGTKENAYRTNLVSNDITMEALFEPA